MSNRQQEVAAALPDYEIGGELGRGAWGIVLAGRHRRLRRAVAIKQLPPALVHDPDVRARFASEARLLASLDHPHIVPVYDYVERDDLCLLVMEQLSGGTVWDRFTAGRMDARTSCAVALVTAAALAYAHSRGVLHRDIKPENLLLAADGTQVKVADFGIAKVLSGDRTQATTDGHVLGTPSYMAPEQARGLEATPATDVYALGSTLYRLLSGRLPFPDAATPLVAMYQRVHEDPRDLRTVAPDVPARVAAVVMRSLERDPTRRQASAETFAAELAAAATASLGTGWLVSTGLRSVLGGRVAALAENPSDDSPAPHPASTAQDPAGPATDTAEVSVVAGDEVGRAGSSAADPARAHELREISLLEDVRAGKVPLRPEEAVDAARLLGADGVAATERLALPRDATPEQIRTRAVEQAQRWRRRSENPLSPRSVVMAAQLLVRTCEGLAADG